MTGKDFRELGFNEIECQLSPVPALQIAVHDAGIFVDREIGAQGKLLEHAAHSMAACRHDPMTAGIAAIGDRAGVWIEAAVDHVDDRRFAGSVVADETDAFAGPNDEVRSVESLDGSILDS